jgi:hypothetical protein
MKGAYPKNEITIPIPYPDFFKKFRLPFPPKSKPTLKSAKNSSNLNRFVQKINSRRNLFRELRKLKTAITRSSVSREPFSLTPHRIKIHFANNSKQHHPISRWSKPHLFKRPYSNPDVYYPTNRFQNALQAK